MFNTTFETVSNWGTMVVILFVAGGCSIAAVISVFQLVFSDKNDTTPPCHEDNDGGYYNHQWTPWTQSYVGNKVKETRHCKRCGTMQVRKIKV